MDLEMRSQNDLQIEHIQKKTQIHKLIPMNPHKLGKYFFKKKDNRGNFAPDDVGTSYSPAAAASTCCPFADPHSVSLPLADPHSLPLVGHLPLGDASCARPT